MKHAIYTIALSALIYVKALAPPAGATPAHPPKIAASVSPPISITKEAMTRAINMVIALEGGYQNYPDDPANKTIGTNKGITPIAYKKHYGKLPTTAQMKALSDSQAFAIYEAMWRSSRICLLKDSISAQVFDTYISMPFTGLQIIEGIVGNIGSANRLSLTDEAIALLNAMPAKELIAQLYEARVAYVHYRCNVTYRSKWQSYYRSKGKSGSATNRKFKQGWLNRLEAVYLPA